jgi:Ca2+-binding RTX toxin-like protein
MVAKRLTKNNKLITKENIMTKAFLNLSDLNGSKGFVLNGIAESDSSGRSVSGAGDINGDGIDDLIIGAYRADPNGYSSGQSYVVFGRVEGFAPQLELSDLDGSNGFALNGIAERDFSGTSVSGAGDVNGDGIDDFIIGAPGAGQSYVVFGRAGGFAAQLELSDLDGSNGFALNGAGSSVSGAGDINGDGIDDLIVGAPYADPNGRDSGQSYVVFGRVEGFAAQLELADLNGSNGFVLNGIAGDDNSGRSVSGAGDLNGDGIDDLIIGAPYADPNGYSSGQSYVVFGRVEGFAPQLELSDLDGSNGFVLNGIAEFDFSGRSVSGAGDLNGDGIDDLIIGADGADPNGIESGQSYVVFGRAEGFAPQLELSDLDGSNGFTLNGIAEFDESGTSVSGAGDINGDGIDDLIIGAPDANPNGRYSGQGYVVFGRPEGFAAQLELADLDGSNGFALNGINFVDSLGNSISGAGDINGDGIDDLIIGADLAAPNGNYSAGQSYVVYGNAAPALDLNGTAPGIDGSATFIGVASPLITPNNLSLSNPNSPNFAIATITITNRLDGAAETLSADTSGTSISANYLNGVLTLTGLDTIANYQQVLSTITYDNSASSPNRTNRSIEFIVEDGADPSKTSLVATTTLSFSKTITPAKAFLNLSDLDGSNGFALNGIDGSDDSGRSVSGAGDINGDGIDDLIVGAPDADPNGNYSGQSYVVFGRPEGFAAQMDLSDLDGSNGFALNGIDGSDDSGTSVSGAGDINGDGIDDLIVGAPDADPNGEQSGQSYVVFGRVEGFAAQLELSDLDGSNGFALNGIDMFDNAGGSVSGAGDINGDGIDDLIIGAYRADPNGEYSGQSYVVFGRVGGFAAQLELSDLDGSNGFALNGAGNSVSGAAISVSGAGDVNGDGIDDFIIGRASFADPNGSFSGQSYVVFGRVEGFAAQLELADLDGSNGFALNGIDEYDLSGRSVSGAGDINGDGIDDLIIGADRADPNGIESGQSYVVFGRVEGFAAQLELADLDGSNGFALNGAGTSVSGAGDINGDGIDDLIIGADRADPNGYSSGQSYVVFGNTSGFAAQLNLSELDGSNGFALNGISERDFSGRSVSGAGDINGDGIDDLIIGAYGADPNGRAGAGQSYVVYGNASPVLDLNGTAPGIDGSATFTGVAIPLVDINNLSLTDRNSPTLARATITITNRLDGSAESLSVDTSGTSIRASFFDEVLILAGIDSVANYQQVLRTVTYNNSASSPNTTNRLIKFVIDDGADLNNVSQVATTTLSFSDTNGGTPGNDILSGTAGTDRLNGLGGDDFIEGKEGNDTLDGGTGNLDRLFGGDGDDTMTDSDGVNGAHGGTGNDAIDVTFASSWRSSSNQSRSDGKITGGFGDDRLTVTMNERSFFINLKGDEPTSKQPDDGNDTVTLLGSYANSVVDLGGGNDTFNGGKGRDNVSAQNGDDNLNGGSGNDQLVGGKGDDLLTGGLGSDNLHGGLGSDRFIYNLLAERGTFPSGDTINEFSPTSDRLDLTELMGTLTGYSGNVAGYLRFTQAGSDALVGIDADGGGNSFVNLATLTNVSTSELLVGSNVLV